MSDKVLVFHNGDNKVCNLHITKSSIWLDITNIEDGKLPTREVFTFDGGNLNKLRDGVR